MSEKTRRHQNSPRYSRERDDRQWHGNDYESRDNRYNSGLSDDRRYDSDYRDFGNDYRNRSSFGNDYSRQPERYGRDNWSSSPQDNFNPDNENMRFNQPQNQIFQHRDFNSERDYGNFNSEYSRSSQPRSNWQNSPENNYRQNEWRNPEYDTRNEYQNRYNSAREPEYRGTSSNWESGYNSYRDIQDPSYRQSYGQGRNERDYSYGEGIMGQGIYGNNYSSNRQAGGYGSRSFGSDLGNQSTNRNNRGRGPIGYRRSDERITEDINDRLSDDTWLDASGIEAKVDNGEVILSGTVDNRDDKWRAEDLAEQVSGIVNVENRIRVGSNSNSRLSSNSGNSSKNETSTSNSKSNKTATTNG